MWNYMNETSRLEKERCEHEQMALWDVKMQVQNVEFKDFYNICTKNQNTTVICPYLQLHWSVGTDLCKVSQANSQTV